MGPEGGGGTEKGLQTPRLGWPQRFPWGLAGKMQGKDNAAEWSSSNRSRNTGGNAHLDSGTLAEEAEVCDRKSSELAAQNTQDAH